MPIQILPARLANQIAAGEVVERPASVIKELVENSLDAGATRIDITVEKGGHKLMRIRDNGAGIAHDELTLALSRHATSKVAHVDDLENILSLGFRGEALASISSVARLTLTSKPAEQSEAWQAYAEGRDMQVVIQPAAHPDGTTIEVVDLFFNTPARRKFLRTEKTEFAHIDELIRRIALSRFDVQINLTHNNKLVRQYRRAETAQAQDKRLAQVCNNAFVSNAIKLDVEHDGMRLWGWVCQPSGCTKQNDNQYSYVNGRMMRDKLINHAIRQAYESTLHHDQQPQFVLFFEISPSQVDVNVHPAKHEVRFHQARLVHDFIFQAIYKVLHQSNSLLSDNHEKDMPQSVASDVNENMQPHYGHSHLDEPQHKVAEHTSSYSHASNVGTLFSPDKYANADNVLPSGQHASAYAPSTLGANASSANSSVYKPQGEVTKPLDTTSLANYTELMSPSAEKPCQKDQQGWRWLSFYQGQYALIEYENMFWWLDTAKLRAECLSQAGSGSEFEATQVATSNNENEHVAQVKSVPLLLPVRVSLSLEQRDTVGAAITALNQNGFTIDKHERHLIVRAVPMLVRESDIATLVSQFLTDNTYLSTEISAELSHDSVQKWLLNKAQHHISESTGQGLLQARLEVTNIATILKTNALRIDPQEWIKRLTELAH
ncbi:DNA mismatch repair endonuclease MutL [Flocculibacter collagenilyticus]|uniref:DNA mismatch repair endonuclease MutL n=1 Tax=Flocculibacter collagenilyticus TaxID=2744479 RepID=UPI0018F64D3B|nr:DNA mismatch repair endonuclease MutL [Flocculibacter collagenilyticus]